MEYSFEINIMECDKYIFLSFASSVIVPKLMTQWARNISIPTFTTGLFKKTFRKTFISIRLAGEFVRQRRKKKYIEYLEVYSETPRKSWCLSKFTISLCISFLWSIR